MVNIHYMTLRTGTNCHVVAVNHWLRVKPSINNPALISVIRSPNYIGLRIFQMFRKKQHFFSSTPCNLEQKISENPYLDENFVLKSKEYDLLSFFL